HDIHRRYGPVDVVLLDIVPDRIVANRLSAKIRDRIDKEPLRLNDRRVNLSRRNHDGRIGGNGNADIVLKRQQVDLILPGCGTGMHGVHMASILCGKGENGLSDIIDRLVEAEFLVALPGTAHHTADDLDSCRVIKLDAGYVRLEVEQRTVR